MHHLDSITLPQVQAVYDGAEGDLWELIMGRQIHVGGMASTQDLAARAAIAAGTNGVDLCCCNGAGMRHLLRFNQVAHMTGVDATSTMIERAGARNQAEGFATAATLVQAEATATGLADAGFDFVWGEDAWCYVADKPGLIAEAARLVPAGGTIAFTDWVAGPAGMAEDDAHRFMTFMKFPSLATIDDYRDLLAANDCEVVAAEDTGRYAPCIDLYLSMVAQQLTSDVLRLLGWDLELFQAVAGEMQFMQTLAHAGRVAQGRFVARKR